MEIKEFLQYGLNRYIILLCIFVSCNKNKKYEKIITENNSTSPYYIALEIKVDTCSTIIVMESNELFSALNICNEIPFKEYKKIIVKTLETKKPLLIDKNCYKTLVNKYSFTITNKQKEYLNNKLKIIITNKAFTDNSTSDMSQDEENYIIATLFEKGYNIQRDCETGYLFIEKRE